MSPLASCEVGVGEGGDTVAHDVVGEGDGCGVHDVVGEGDGGGVHGVEVEGDVAVQTVEVGVEVGGRTVEEGVCKVHVQNAAQEGSMVQAGNDHWVKSRHLGHCGIAMQDKENMFLSKPVGSMVMIKPRYVSSKYTQDVQHASDERGALHVCCCDLPHFTANCTMCNTSIDPVLARKTEAVKKSHKST